MKTLVTFVVVKDVKWKKRYGIIRDFYKSHALLSELLKQPSGGVL